MKGISVHTQAIGDPNRGISESQRQRVPTFGRLDAHIGRCMMRSRSCTSSTVEKNG